MIDVTKLVVRSFDLDHLDIAWETSTVAGVASDGQHAIYDYDFYVLRSTAAEGPYEQIAGPLRDKYRLRDMQVNLLHAWREFFYKVKVVHRPTGEEKTFGPSSNFGAPPDLIAAEIMRNQDVVLREYMGRRCYLFPARTFGPRCSCYDVTLGQITRANHKPCYGTGWLGGYMTPVEIWVQIDPVAKSPTIVANVKKAHLFHTTARLGAYPPVSKDDVIIENENRRWRVEAVSPSERLRAVVHQELVVSEIPRGDVEYDLPVHADPTVVEAASPRNFTNPQNLESGSYDDIFRVFGHPLGSTR